MPREIVTVEIGQCGLQLGSRFWELALAEHQKAQQQSQQQSSQQSKSHQSSLESSLSHLYDDPATTFFDIDNSGNLSARAVLIDTELGVLSAINKSKHSALYSSNNSNIVSDVSGAGNNFAHGHFLYGPQLEESFANSIQSEVEKCDSLQSFMIVHSTGGGTGSGLGSYVQDWLADSYPAIYRFDNCILPSDNDDVITSPYNATLCLDRIIASADAVMPCDNQALIDICQKYSRGSLANNKKSVGGGFRDLNLLCASALSSLTAGMRFGGELNVDINDLIMNLIPQPQFKFLIPGLSPIHTIFNNAENNKISNQTTKTSNTTNNYQRNKISSNSLSNIPVPHPTQLFHTLAMAKQVSSSRVSVAAQSIAVNDGKAPPIQSLASSLNKTSNSSLKSLDATFSSSLNKSSQLIEIDLTKGVYLTSSFLCRGESLSFGLLQRQISLLTPSMEFAYHKNSSLQSSSIKLGLCSQSSTDSPLTVLSLANSSAIASRIDFLTHRARSLFTRKAHFHHYTECGLEEQQMIDAIETLQEVSKQYKLTEKM